MIVKGKVTRTVVLEKEVEIEVSDDASVDKIEFLIKEEAYRIGIMDYAREHGWFCTKLKSLLIEQTGKKEV